MPLLTAAATIAPQLGQRLLLLLEPLLRSSQSAAPPASVRASSEGGGLLLVLEPPAASTATAEVGRLRQDLAAAQAAEAAELERTRTARRDADRHLSAARASQDAARQQVSLLHTCSARLRDEELTAAGAVADAAQARRRTEAVAGEHAAAEEALAELRGNLAEVDGRWYAEVERLRREIDRLQRTGWH